MWNRIRIALSLAAPLLLASCGGGNGSSSSSINVAGNWQFDATSNVFDSSYSATGTMNQNGSSLSGTLTLSGTPCAQSADFSGKLNGTNIDATLNENGQNTAFSGTVTTDGNSASGTYQSPAGGCTNGDAGTFTGQRISTLNGMFRGSFGPANSPAANIAASLRDDGGTVVGSATVTNSLCFHSLRISGVVSGADVELEANEIESEQKITFHGKYDRSRRALDLAYSTLGSYCSVESGTAEMHLVR